MFADSDLDAREQAQEIIDNHVFEGVQLVSAELVEPGDLYHDV